MKYCGEHTKLLATQLTDFGLGRWVPRNQQQVDILDKEDEPDALYGAMNTIVEMALPIFGESMLGMRCGNDGMPANEKHYCPLCLIKREHEVHVADKCIYPKCTLKIVDGEPEWVGVWVAEAVSKTLYDFKLMGKLNVQHS